MTGVDKILVIIVLVFSVVFVIAAIGGFSKTQQQLQARDDEIAKLKSKAEQSESSGRQTVAILEKSQGAKDESDRQLQESLKTIKSKDEALADLGARNSALEAEAGQYKNMIDEFKGRLEALGSEVGRLTEKFDEMTKDNERLRVEATDAKNRANHYDTNVIPNKNKEIEELKRQIEVLSKGAAGGSSSGGEGNQRPQIEVPKVSCTVLDVRRGSEGPAIVGLDKGGKDGLKAGVKMYVWNSIESLKARITIIEVDENSSIARIDWEKEGLQVKNGDTATVQDF